MIVVLSGGVGGARLCAGLVQVFGPDRLLVVVNTGDDFDHWGLRICPDLDTVLYTLSGRVDEKQGWGVAGDTWRTLEEVARQGGEDWFRLGDQDLATHLARTSLLARGHTLTEATARLFAAAGVAHRVVPATDADHRTIVKTDQGLLAFQDYFVRLRCAPRLEGVCFEDETPPMPSPALATAMAQNQVEAVFVCPSNPVLSLQPILAVEGVREWLERRRFPVLGVSPFLGRSAVKGPAAKIFCELGLQPGVGGLTRFYEGLVDGWLVDPRDAEEATPEGVHLRPHHILLDSAVHRGEVAKELSDWLALGGGA